METLLIAGIGLLALSVFLLFVEAFVPSGGVISLVALVCAVVGVGALFRHSVLWGSSGLLTVLVLGPIAFFWGIKMLPDTPLGRRLIGPSAEDIATASRNEEQQVRDARLALIDARGTTVTDLRPVGVVEIQGQHHDATAEGGLIDRGTPIRVTGIDGMQIRVRAVT
jgi:membrane-bound ClpP family serine protease